MCDPTAAQQQRLNAALATAEELRRQIDSVLGSDLSVSERARLVLEFYREMQGLAATLQGIPGVELGAEVVPVDFDAARRAIESLRQQREPSDSELELIELTKQMLAKHEIIPSDFEALYRWRRDLEARIAERFPQNPT